MYVYDLELGTLNDDIEEGSLEDMILSYQLSDKSIALEVSDVVKHNKDRFVFLTEEDVKNMVIERLNARNPIIDNVAFQKKFKFDEEQFDEQKLSFRMDLLKEEFNETIEAYENQDAEEWVDGHIDMMVIILGNLFLAGVSVNKAWTEVFRANMAKERGIKPGREQSGGWDLIKLSTWVKPDHTDNHGFLARIWGAIKKR